MTETVFLLLALFGIKHFIADFVMQYDYMVRDKGIYGAPGGLHHAGVHAALTFWVLVMGSFTGYPPDAYTIVALSALDFVIHYHVDYVKQQLNKGLTPADDRFWVWLGLDQALHYLTYVGIIYVITS